jgi:hypothetical protein
VKSRREKQFSSEQAMQKLVAILEKNVEWFALGLGGLFFLYMIYGFIIQKPVTSNVGPAVVTPGEVDPTIQDGPAKDLKIKMDDRTVPKMVVKNFVQDVEVAFAGPTTPLPQLPGYNGPSNQEVSSDLNKAPTPPPPSNTAQVTHLPEPAAPFGLDYSQGRSNVVQPLPGAAAAAAAGGGNPNPAQLAGAAADKNWVTVSGVISMKSLADQWIRNKIPPQPNTTTILRVELVREEQNLAGGWGDDVTVPPLLNVNLQPMPPKDAPPGVAQPYQQWAEGDQKDICQPDFYTVSQGDSWLIPGQLPPNAANAQVVDTSFDPAKVKSSDIKNLTPDQKKQYDDYRKQQDEQKRQEQRQRWQQSHPPGGSGGGAGRYSPPPAGGGPSYAPMDPDRPLTLAQATPPRYPPPPPVPYEGPMAVPGPQPSGQPNQPGSPPPIGPLPNPGSFDPIAMSTPQPGAAPVPAPPVAPVSAGPNGIPLAQLGQGDVTIWAHDDSVQPGHTYRYKLRYIIRNPVYNTQQLCNPQALANVFTIQSADSDWTPAVSVKSETNLFVVQTSPGGTGTVTFDIFRWKNGAWQMQTFKASPGDMVGSVQTQLGQVPVDFTTGLTLVDVRRDPKNDGNYMIILSGDNGLLIKHDYNADRASEDYKKLKDQINNAAAAAKPVASSATPGQ